MSGNEETPTPQPWAADGRNGSDWSSTWRSGGENDPAWGGGGPGNDPNSSRSDGIIFEGNPVELAVGVPVKYNNRCASDTGPVDRGVLVDRQPFDSPFTPRIVNLGKCPVFLAFASKPNSDGLRDAIDVIRIEAGATLEDGIKIPDGTDSYGVYCRNCSEGMLHITIERPMV